MAVRQGRQVDSVDLLTESDSEDSEDMSGSDADEASWISWFCSLRGNEFFCEVEEPYIEDDFNLSGLQNQVPYYEYALDMILDNEPPAEVMLTDQQHEMLENAAEMLYGLIHARYLVTARGLSAMLEKFKNCDFGRCPRVLCDGQPCLPVGTSDLPGTSTVKIFCPKCEDIYYPRIDCQCSIDGAYFGTTFPHLMLMTYPMYRPPKSSEAYVPRVFGFKLHPTAYANRDGGQQGGGGARALPAAAAAAGGGGAAAGGGAGGGGGGGGAGMQQQQQQQQPGQQQQQQQGGQPPQRQRHQQQQQQHNGTAADSSVMAPSSSAAAAAAAGGGNGGSGRQQQQPQQLSGGAGGSQAQSMDQDEEEQEQEDAEMAQGGGSGQAQGQTQASAHKQGRPATLRISASGKGG